MLIAFSVENYKSFKERVTLSMVAADIHSKPVELDSDNIFQARDAIKLLTSAAVYGANASGKSNLVAAIGFMRSLVLNSSRETRLREPVNVTPYRLSSETEDQPSFFEIVFIDQGSIYRYGFRVSRKQIEEEWLYATKDTKEGYLFKRIADTIEVNRRSFKEGHGLEERTRPNALFLSVAAQWNGKRASQLLEWFEDLTVTSGIDDLITKRILTEWYEKNDLPPHIVAFVKALDLGIADIRIERVPPREVELPLSDGSTRTATFIGSTRIRTVHSKYNSKGEPIADELFDLFTDESQGTQRLFDLAAPILSALRGGTVLVIDEIDARLHPILTSEIIRIFNSPEANPRHAQLIVTTHDTNLLDAKLLRRDQIWFVEKSRRGVSALYSLVEYRLDKRIVRNNALFERDYIAGRYGAIPYLGLLSATIGASDAESEESEESAREAARSGHSDLPPTLVGDEG